MSAIRGIKKFFPKVTKVIDATSNARIEVLKKDINSSAVKQHDACAMAVACKRKFKLDGVIISRTTAYLIKGNQARRFKLPPSVEKEIVSFDRGAGFAPGTYELTKVPPSSKLGSRERPQYSKNRSVKEKRAQHITTEIRTDLRRSKEL